MTYASLRGRLGRIEARIEHASLSGTCPQCRDGRPLELIYKGDPPRGCPGCGRIGDVVIITPELDTDGQRVPAEAGMIV